MQTCALRQERTVCRGKALGCFGLQVLGDYHGSEVEIPVLNVPAVTVESGSVADTPGIGAYTEEVERN